MVAQDEVDMRLKGELLTPSPWFLTWNLTDQNLVEKIRPVPEKDPERREAGAGERKAIPGRGNSSSKGGSWTP